jgi:hypothetical protein
MHMLALRCITCGHVAQIAGHRDLLHPLAAAIYRNGRRDFRIETISSEADARQLAGEMLTGTGRAVSCDVCESGAALGDEVP